jgi:hypothetical protein
MCVKQQDEKAKKDIDKSKAKQTDLERTNFVFSWASSACASAAAATARSASKRDDASDSSISKESIKKNQKSGSGAVSGASAVSVTREGIYTTSQHPLTLRLMQLLCGAASILYPTVAASGKTSVQDDLAAADSDQQVTCSITRPLL